MLAFCKPSPEYEVLSVPRSPAKAVCLDLGGRYYPEDHPSPGSRRWEGWVGVFNRRDLQN